MQFDDKKWVDKDELLPPPGVIGNGNRKRRASANFDPAGVIGNGNRKRRASANFDPAGVIGNGNRKRRASANLNAVFDKDELLPPPGVIGNGNRKRRASANLNGDPHFLSSNCNQHVKIHLFAKLKKILRSRFRATLNKHKN